VDPFASFGVTNGSSPFDSNDPFASSNIAPTTTSSGFDDVWSSSSKPAAKTNVVSFDDAFGPSTSNGEDNWANTNGTNNNPSSNNDSSWAAFDDGINITNFFYLILLCTVSIIRLHKHYFNIFTNILLLN
jgi:hypothetical protein